MLTDLSRRSILKFAAAGSAATLPAVALAAPDRIPVDPVQLSDKDLLEHHMAEVEKLLCRMHPLTERPSHGFETRDDGTYMAFFYGAYRTWLPWKGPGLYRVSDQGYLNDYWIEPHRRLRSCDGRACVEEYRLTRWYEGEYIDREYPRYRIELHIVERLEGGAAPC